MLWLWPSDMVHLLYNVSVGLILIFGVCCWTHFCDLANCLKNKLKYLICIQTGILKNIVDVSHIFRELWFNAVP